MHWLLGACQWPPRRRRSPPSPPLDSPLPRRPQRAAQRDSTRVLLRALMDAGSGNLGPLRAVLGQTERSEQRLALVPVSLPCAGGASRPPGW